MKSSSEPIVAPVLTWCVISILPLLVCASHIQCWPGAAAPIEQYALPMVAAVQVAAASLLFPWLLRDARAATFAMLITLPLLQLAALMSDATWHSFFFVVFCTEAWLICLRIWARMVEQTRYELAAVAIASTICIGLICLEYLRMDFAGIDGFSGGKALIGTLACVLAGSFIKSRRRSRG